MASSTYENKYPEIIIDTDTQSANPLLKKAITVEEWNDLLHHTHKEFNSSTADGTPITDENASRILDKLDELTTLIQDQANDISDIKTRTENIEAYIEQDIQIDDGSTNTEEP